MTSLRALIVLQMASTFACLAAQNVELPAQPGDTSKLTLPYIEREFYLPHPMASPVGLDVLEVRANVPGQHPLALITHGTAVTPAERAQVTPWRFLPQALWFRAGATSSL